MAFYDNLIAALSAMFRLDAEPYIAQADAYSIKSGLTGLAPIAGGGVIVETFAGLPSGAGAIYDAAYDIGATPIIFSVAAGAMVPLAITTDFTYLGKRITFLAAHTGETILLFYVPAKTWA